MKSRIALSKGLFWRVGMNTNWHARWTLRLMAGDIVELGMTDSLNWDIVTPSIE
jgi:hypothetical protein